MMPLVAPHAGAWIETPKHLLSFLAEEVAPHAGAWIETVSFDLIIRLHTSHPMRVRGLKQQKTKTVNSLKHVAPHAGAWIETFSVGGKLYMKLSRTPCGCVD